MEKKLLEALAKLLNIKPEEFEESLKLEDGNVRDDIVSHVSGLFRDHIKSVRKSAKEEESKKSFREARESFETEILERYEVENPDKLKGLELIDLVIDAKKVVEVKEVKGKPAEITDEVIKKHPLFINLESEYQKYKGSEDERLKNARSEVEGQFKKELTFGKIKDFSVAHLKSFNPVLSPDPVKASRQIDSLLITDLSQYDYQIPENGKVEDAIVLKKDGSRLENELGHAMKLAELTEQITKNSFDLQQSKDIRMPGNGNGKQTGTPHIEIPRTDEEMLKMIRDKSIPIEQRTAVHEKFIELQTQT